MFHKDGSRRRTWKGRAFSLFLAAVLLLGSVPGFVLPSSAHWADPYLDQLVDWGVMRADQTDKPDAPLTRAEFMAIINRAYGYHEIGEMPFEDVSEGDWFYDDVAIAYNAGYMKGTSKTTASPNAHLTREQAVCILGRNMMMKETPGEDLAFTDSRSISNWAKGMVKTAVNQYIIGGFPDDTFRPKDNITKGQMAVLMTQCVGNPVSQSGAYELGDVSGNLTITAPNVTLRNTTVSGDLYVSGGVGLGGIKLENVNVLGRIVVSGTGESEAGGASVVMRNVTANEMLVDNMRDKTVTIRADGITEIPKTVVRTSAYIEDNNTDDKGLMSIELDGDSGSRLTLAGRIKEVIDKTPNSLIQAAKGTVAKLTVDEAAINANVQLDRNTSVKELNLDVAANVTGDGDIDQLNVNAAGSVVSMLPDKIYIRPGLTGNIGGVIMDHTDAEEGSLDPRLLSGYPAARDITPTGLRADFSGNKKGTVYWAVSSLTDGSVGEDDLISPPSYGSKAIRNGSVALPTGGSEVSAQVTGLTVGGSYYLSAILVDDLGNCSPVKVISFSTPDNTVPAFGQGYPYMSFVGRANEYDNGVTAQVAVMATKTCRMYYAVLPAGAAAPTADELRSASVSSNVGYGVVELEKNDVWDGDRAIIVSRRLAEQKDYVLYLWLTDGVNSSEVTSLAITTPDVTPPEFVAYPRVNGDAQATSVPMTATINENGTIYWVAVKSGADYPLPNPSNDKENTEDGKTARLDSEYAKIQVANGMNAVSRGSVTAQANTPVNLNITGLEAETSYDIYFLVRDTAGNDARSVYKVDGGIRTLDTGAPTVRQIFTKFDGTDNSLNPMRDTDIILEFSENVRFGSNGKDLLSLYRATQEGTASEKEKALDDFVNALRSGIDFKVSKFGIPQSAVLGNPGVESDEWAIDFSSAVVANVNGTVQITFPNSGLKLDSGGIYNFEFNNLEDLSEHPMKPEGEKLDYSNDEENGHKIPQFTVVFARISLTDILPLPDDQLPEGIVNANYPGAEGGYRADFKFRMIPDDMESVSDDISYDMLIWNDCNEGIVYDLYFRAVTDSGRVLTVERDADGNFLYGMPNMSTKVHALDKSGWILLGNSSEHFFNSELSGKSLQGQFNQCTEQSYPKLKKLLAKTEDTGEKVYYDFIISVRSMKGQTDPRAWSGEVNFYVDIAAGVSSTLAGMGVSPLEASWATFVREGLNSSRGGESIGSPNKPAGTSYPDRNRLHMSWDYRDTVQPVFSDGFPKFVNIGEDSATMNLSLNRDGTVYYVIGYADVNGSEPSDTTQWQPSPIPITVGGERVRPENVPLNGEERDKLPELINPSKLNIQQPSTLQGSVIVGKGEEACKGGNVTPVPIEKLEANRTYYVYLVITGAGAEPSAVEMYKFKTNPVSRPVITITPDYSTTPARASMSTDIPSTLTYKVYAKSAIQQVVWMTDGHYLRDSDILNPAYRGQLPQAYQNYTVYQALRTPYEYSDASSQGAIGYFPTDGSGNPAGFTKRYSVFDIYASDSAKSKLRTWLEVDATSAGLATIGGEPATADPGTTTNVAAGGRAYSDTVIESNTTYYVLTMACRNPLDTNVSDNSIGLYYSFMGREIEPNDTAPPRLRSAVGTFNLTSSNTLKEGGYITLNFDKALYKDKNVPLTKEDLAAVFTPSSGIDFAHSTISNDRNVGVVTLMLEPGATGVTMSVAGTGLKNSEGIGADAQLNFSYAWPSQTTPDTGRYLINVTWTDYSDDRNSGSWKIYGERDQPVDSAPPELRGMNPNFTVAGDIPTGTISLTFSKKLYIGSGSPYTAVANKADFVGAGSTEDPAGWIGSVTVNDETNNTCTVVLTFASGVDLQTNSLTLKIPSGYLKNVSGYGAEADLELKIERVAGSVGPPVTTTHYDVTATFGSDPPIVKTVKGTS